MSRKSVRASVLLALVLALANGCSQDASPDLGEIEVSTLEAEGLRDLKFTFTSDGWKASVARGDGEPAAMRDCKLNTASRFDMGEGFVLVCRDGRHELLVDVEANVGRIRDLEHKMTAGARCTVERLPNDHRGFECRASGRVEARFAEFDQVDLDRVRGFLPLPSVATSEQPRLVEEAERRLRAPRLRGEMGGHASCLVESERRSEGTLVVVIRQEAGNKKLVDFEATRESVLAAAEGDGFYALQSIIADGATFSGRKNRKLVITTNAEGLKVEIISSDSGGASGKYCQWLRPA